jgi:di/tricarboxylate transporter
MKPEFVVLGLIIAGALYLLLLGVIVMALTNILTPAISIPLAAMAALLLGCVKLSDTYKSVDWPAIATVGGMISLMISLGLALEKTGAAGALAHFIVTSFQQAGAISIFCALLAFTVALTQCRRATRGEKGKVGNSPSPIPSSSY